MNFKSFILFTLCLLTGVYATRYQNDENGKLIEVTKRDTRVASVETLQDGTIRIEVPLSLATWQQLSVVQSVIQTNYAYEVTGSRMQFCYYDGVCINAVDFVAIDELFNVGGDLNIYPTGYEFVRYSSPAIQYPKYGVFGASFEVVANGNDVIAQFDNIPIILEDPSKTYTTVKSTQCYQNGCFTTAYPMEKYGETYSPLVFSTAPVPTTITVTEVTIDGTVTTVTTICVMTESFTPSTSTSTTIYTDCSSNTFNVACTINDNRYTIGPDTITLSTTNCDLETPAAGVSMVTVDSTTTHTGIDVTSTYTITNVVEPTSYCSISFIPETATLSISITDCLSTITHDCHIVAFTTVGTETIYSTSCAGIFNEVTVTSGGVTYTNHLPEIPNNATCPIPFTPVASTAPIAITDCSFTMTYACDVVGFTTNGDVTLYSTSCNGVTRETLFTTASIVITNYIPETPNTATCSSLLSSTSSTGTSSSSVPTFSSTSSTSSTTSTTSSSIITLSSPTPSTSSTPATASFSKPIESRSSTLLSTSRTHGTRVVTTIVTTTCTKNMCHPTTLITGVTTVTENTTTYTTFCPISDASITCSPIVSPAEITASSTISSQMFSAAPEASTTPAKPVEVTQSTNSAISADQTTPTTFVTSTVSSLTSTTPLQPEFTGAASKNSVTFLSMVAWVVMLL